MERVRRALSCALALWLAAAPPSAAVSRARTPLPATARVGALLRRAPADASAMTPRASAFTRRVAELSWGEPARSAALSDDWLPHLEQTLEQLSGERLDAAPPEQVEELSRRLLSRIDAPPAAAAPLDVAALDDRLRDGAWGPRLLAAVKRQRRGQLQRAQDRVFEAMLSEERLKKRMIAFLDVAVAAPPQRLQDLLRQYLPASTAAPGLLGTLLAAGRSPLVPSPLVGLGARAGVADMGRRFLAGRDTRSAVRRAERLERDGLLATLDVVQEHVVSKSEQARQARGGVGPSPAAV